MQAACSRLLIVEHPLIQDRLTKIRSVDTQSGEFRSHVAAIGSMLFYEASRQLLMAPIQIQTPMQGMQAKTIQSGLVLIAVLRAGMGFLDGILPTLPAARVGYLGLARNPQTLQAESYYTNVPLIVASDQVFVLDPMLATGHTALVALAQMQKAGARNLHLITLLASPVGIAAVQKSFPEVAIITAAVDSSLNEKGYILPGLGDAGDRLYGTQGH